MDRGIRQARWERRGLGLAQARICEARLHLSVLDQRGSGLARGQATLSIGAWAVLLSTPETGPESHCITNTHATGTCSAAGRWKSPPASPQPSEGEEALQILL